MHAYENWMIFLCKMWFLKTQEKGRNKSCSNVLTSAIKAKPKMTCVMAIIIAAEIYWVFLFIRVKRNADDPYPKIEPTCTNDDKI